LLRREREKSQTKREQELDNKFKEILDQIKAAQLSPRETEILLMKADKTNKEIADSLCRSIETIKKITDKLHKKFNVHRDIDLIKYAMALQQKEDKGQP
jgi:DNA-binding CsgD family transcriptional regulator